MTKTSVDVARDLLPLTLLAVAELGGGITSMTRLPTLTPIRPLTQPSMRPPTPTWRERRGSRELKDSSNGFSPSQTCAEVVDRDVVDPP